MKRTKRPGTTGPRGNMTRQVFVADHGSASDRSGKKTQAKKGGELDTVPKVNANGNGHNKVKVDGARRVWGTLRNCTTKAVSTTISKLCGISPAKVKRKFKKNDTGRLVRWWYVIHDSEEVLSSLDTIWDKLQVHTSWKLEPCYMSQSLPMDNLASPANNDNAPIVEGQLSPEKLVLQTNVESQSPTQTTQTQSLPSPSQSSQSSTNVRAHEKPSDATTSDNSHFLEQQTLVVT